MNKLFAKTRIYLFIFMVIGLFMAIGGFVKSYENISAVGIIMTLTCAFCATLFASFDEIY